MPGGALLRQYLACRLGSVFAAVGVKSTPKGGFGNRVLNYLNVRQIAHQLGARYFNVNQVDKARIRGINKPWLGRYVPGTKLTITRDDIYRPGFFDFAHEQIEMGHTLVFKPRLLDDTLAHVAVTDSREFARPTMVKCQAHQSLPKSDTNVVLHLRGPDFSSWNPEAIHGADYYIEALQLIASEYGEDTSIRICSDDPSHPARKELDRYLASIGAKANDITCTNPFECDFSAMAESDVLVASPSTFGVTAALLGKPRVIFQRRWVQSQAERGERFWQKVQEKTMLGLQVQALV